MKALILLTAAVTPDPAFVAPGAAFRTVVADPDLRAQQYRRGVAYWQRVAGSVGGAVAVVETTGAVRRDLIDGLHGHFIGFDTPAELAMHGKGAIEAAAIDHALEHLDLPADTALIKVTGRLLVSNAERLICPLGDALVQVRRSLDRSFADSRFMFTTVGAWREHFVGMGAEVDEANGLWLERVAAQRMIVGEYERRLTVQRFVDPPRFVGVSGTTGARYDGWWSRVAPSVVQRKTEGAARRLLGGRLV